ncbi:MAG: transposase [Melioribacteraceae bacterium]|nr:transposase [Melioribacteraceae bacterium]
MGRRNRTNFEEEQFYFVTTTIKDFKNIFKYEECCKILISNIKHYQLKYEYEILGYVIMPNHFHWIVRTKPEKGTISSIMRDVKKYSAWGILDFLEETEPDLDKSFILKTNGKQKRQLWIHRFDDEVIRNEKMFWVKLKYIHNNLVKAGVDQRQLLFPVNDNYLRL